VVARIRYIEKFEDRLGVQSYTFPLALYEYQSQQGLRIAQAPAVGADYEYDFHRYFPAPKEVGVETIRFLNIGNTAALLETQIDDIRNKLYSFGRGKLWALASDGTRRWAWGRLRDMPTIQVGVGRFRYTPHVLTFLRTSDWQEQNATTGSQAINAAGTVSFNIVAGGNAPIYDAVFRLRSNSATGWIDPTIYNNTNAYRMQTTRDATGSNDELKIDGNSKKILWSTDDGVNYANDYANFAYGSAQHDWFRLEGGGTSQIQISTPSGTPNFNFEWSFYAKWH
jgi:hypothetical protein